MNSISGKCIICNDTGIINKGTKVEEPCPICHLEDPFGEICNHDWQLGTNGYTCRKCLVWMGEIPDTNGTKVALQPQERPFFCTYCDKQVPCGCDKKFHKPLDTFVEFSYFVCKNCGKAGSKNDIHICEPKVESEWEKDFTEKFLRNFGGGIVDWSEEQPSIEAVKAFISNLLTSQKSQLIKEVEEMPIDKAHTYASENADIYRAYDDGQENYKNKVLTLLKT